MDRRVRRDTIPEDVTTLCRELARHGHRAWVVGGCLRDLLRGERPSDWDLATSARPEQVRKVFPRVIPTGIQHGTVTVRMGGHGYEVTTLRGEGAYSDGRRPDSIEFVDDIELDLARRDFTVNAIAYDPISDQLEDPFDGLRDLERGIIRAVGRAEERFSEDGLRVLRAARFVATLEFELDPETEAAIAPTLATFRKVSAERVREEWVKALKARAPSRAFAVMKRTGILEVTCEALARLGQAELDASFRALDAAPREVCLRMAALLSPWSELEEVRAFLTRYRFSNQERDHIARMLEHMPATFLSHESDESVRRLARRVGREALRDLLAVSEQVASARFGADSTEHRNVRALTQRVATAVTSATPLTSRELALTGHDLMRELGLAPGRGLGALIDRLLERTLEDPALNTREHLLELAKALSKDASP